MSNKKQRKQPRPYTPPTEEEERTGKRRLVKSLDDIDWDDPRIAESIRRVFETLATHQSKTLRDAERH